LKTEVACAAAVNREAGGIEVLEGKARGSVAISVLKTEVACAAVVNREAGGIEVLEGKARGSVAISVLKTEVAGEVRAVGTNRVLAACSPRAPAPPAANLGALTWRDDGGERGGAPVKSKHD